MSKKKYTKKKERRGGILFGEEVEVTYDEDGNEVATAKEERSFWNGKRKVTRDTDGNKLSETKVKEDWVGNKYKETKTADGKKYKSEIKPDKERHREKGIIFDGEVEGKTEYKKKFFGDDYKEVEGRDPELGKLNDRKNKSQKSNKKNNTPSYSGGSRSSTKKKKYKTFNKANYNPDTTAVTHKKSFDIDINVAELTEIIISLLFIGWFLSLPFRLIFNGPSHYAELSFWTLIVCLIITAVSDFSWEL